MSTKVRRHDPEAARVVLEQAWDVTPVWLDVTDDTLFGAADLARVESASSAASRIVASMTPFYMRFYEPILSEYACAMHSAAWWPSWHSPTWSVL